MNDVKNDAKKLAGEWLQKTYPDATMALVWRAHSEPKELGGWDVYNLDDYDWVLAIPPSWDANRYIPWAEEGGAFGCCEVEDITLGCGWSLLVGHHS